MQIIQALLGNQVNTLGQKSYLGNHHQLFPQSAPNLHYRHSNFITPLVTLKPLFTPSKLLLARKGQPFIDTLITDDDNLVGRDMDNDFPGMEWETYNSLPPEHSRNQLTDITFNLGNISNLLQSKIATNVSNDILLEMAIQSKPKTTRKNTTQKSPKRKPSPSKTQPKKSAKSSKTKKVNQVVDETASYTSTAEENLLITDNYQSEIFNLTENYPTIQAQINIDNTIIDNSESKIKFSNLEDNLTLQRQIADNEPEVITDLPSNSNDIVNESDIRETGKISTQNSGFDSNISDSSEHSPVETQSLNIEEQINIVNNFTNHQAPIVSEISQDFDILDIPVSTNSPQENTENSNITNDISSTQVDIIPKENLLSTDRNLHEIIDNSSDLLAANDQNANNSNLVETKPLASEIITPKFENTANSFTHLDNTQKQPVVSDEFSPEITAKSVSESNTLVTNKNTIDISQEINTDNLTRESIDTPDIQSNSHLETNQIPAENPEATIPEIREIPAVTKSDIQSNSNLETNQILAENPEATTSEIREIPPVTTSPVSPKSDEVNTPNSTIITPDTADISPSNITDNLPIFRNILDNAPPTTSESSLAFESVDLSTFINNSDISESTSSQDNEDTSSSIDIETNTGLNNLPAPKGYATGGQVTTTAVENHQPVAPSDTVPAMLTPGEFVINAKDTQKNLQILKHINTGGSPEEIISPSLEVANTQTPEETNFLEPTTKVDSFTDGALQRKEAESNSSSEPTALTSPSLGVEIGKQRLSILNSPQINTVENTTNNTRESSPHYSSPSLIFRKSNLSTNTETPSQWSSIEELLNSNHDQSSNFNFNSVESNWQNSPSSQVSSFSTPSNVFTKRLSTPQGFANGGEVIAPDISRDIAPITETIESPYSSLPTEKNDDNEDDDGKLEILAQEIYYRLRQKIEIEKERQGKYIGRLPW